ncbi:GTPase/DUF3482 domain-containing protein [Nitrincola sp. MINF-07-Sa-05]|uniref:GTPase/DUF3482 domain-containing protein n=1 Tax=Nitrincola salilacus TaxID=3400273 RepID=UPI003917D996
MTPNSPLKVAVVGHTNAGKTSLLRTLLRDESFGEVSNHAGTTRHSEAASLLLDGEPAIDFVDTPGFEDSIGLLTALEELQKTSGADRLESLRLICKKTHEYPEFDQEIKVVRQLLSNELFFYVIDVREPVLGKYINELEILAYAARPAIPVLNFTASPSAQTRTWKEHLARLNFHTQVVFDTVAFRADDEKRLLKQMQTILSDRYELLESIIEQHVRQQSELVDNACRIISELLTDAGGLYIDCANNESAINTAQATLQDKIRDADTRCMQSVLQLYRFQSTTLSSSALNIDQGEWKLDLFDDTNLQRFGVAVGSGAAKGALLGAGFDLFTAGMSLGAGTATGALAGALLQTGQRYRHELSAKIKGHRSICATEPALSAMLLRQLDLLNKLQHRGHAAVDAVTVESMSKEDLPEEFQSWIKHLHENPQWSRLGTRFDSQDEGRSLFITQVAGAIKSKRLK